MDILLFLIVGAMAGVVASKILQLELTLLPAIGFGIGGSVLGWLIVKLLSALFGILLSLIFAIVGAVFLMWVWKRLSR